MPICAYCGNNTQLTKEHVIPRWFTALPSDSEVFNARSPINHVSGDILIKDVCQTCNNVKLGELDSYGKYLYNQFFGEFVYAGETIIFDYDQDLLFRWLLKLSFNSARAHNADTEILSMFVDQMLGKSPFDQRVRVFVNLVIPSNMDDTPSPAARKDVANCEIYEPGWFRIAQLRMPECKPTLPVVQRLVAIQSYAFSIFAIQDEATIGDLDAIVSRFLEVFPTSVELDESNQVEIAAGTQHAFESISQLWLSYPNRYLDMNNPLITKLHSGEGALILLNVPRELVEQGQPEPIIKIIYDMISDRECVTAYLLRVSIMFDGYDQDSRALWQIPESKAFIRALFIACPFVMLISHPDGAMLKLFANCWVYEDGMNEAHEKSKMKEFLELAFDGLNQIAYSLALSIEKTKEISREALNTLYGEYPP